MMAELEGEFEPEWAHRAKYIDHKPEWQDKIPHLLYELEDVFFPIPPRNKGWSYPHHMDEYRYAPDSEVLNAYFDSGWEYGVACDGDLAVVDIDASLYIDRLMGVLPDTAYQWTGSRTGVHLFYYVPGINQVKNLTSDIVGATVHVGEIRGNVHSYVVGPNSRHPSGNKYGPLKGDEIATIEEEELFELLDEFISEDDDNYDDREGLRYVRRYIEGEDRTIEDIEGNTHPFYQLNADDVMPGLTPEERTANPVHGSTTGTNFMKNPDGKTFTCWRCQIGSGPGCGINAQQLLALLEIGNRFGAHACEEVRRNWTEDSSLHYHAWVRAVKDGLVSPYMVPYRVAHGYAVASGIMDNDEKLQGDMYFDMINAVRYEMDMLEIGG